MHRFPIIYILLGSLIALGLGVGSFVYLQNQSNIKQTKINFPEQDQQTLQASEADDVVPSGPVDIDIRAQAEEREREIQARLKELENQVKAAQERAEESEQALEETKERLKEVTLAKIRTKPCPTGMIHIKEGPFYLGSSTEDKERNDLVEAHLSLVKSPSFCIDKYEFPNRRGSMPRVNVSWNEAQSICRSEKKRLCNKDEWERACKGPASEENKNRNYAYGNLWNPDACNTRQEEDLDAREIQRSGAFSDCVSPDGVFDLGGNVDEWTRSAGAFNTQSAVTKGGSAARPGYQSRCASLREVAKTTAAEDLGFRCCKDPQ